jgi:hypothetical protein
MLPLLGHAGVIDDPGLNGTARCYRCQGIRPDRLEYYFILPRGIGHQVMQRLVGLAHPLGSQQGCHRLDTLARAGQHQTGQITTQRLAPISMTQALRQALHIGPKTLSRGAQKSLYCPTHVIPPLFKRSMCRGHFVTL